MTRVASGSRRQSRRDTAGCSVDIVLNSVTGAAQLAGLKLLALGGRFIESANATSTPIPDWNSCHSSAVAFYGLDLGLMSVAIRLRSANC